MRKLSSIRARPQVVVGIFSPFVQSKLILYIPTKSRLTGRLGPLADHWPTSHKQALPASRKIRYKGSARANKTLIDLFLRTGCRVVGKGSRRVRALGMCAKKNSSSSGASARTCRAMRIAQLGGGRFEQKLLVRESTTLFFHSTFYPPKGEKKVGKPAG